jgi:cyclase
MAFASMAEPVAITQNAHFYPTPTLSGTPAFENIAELANGVFFAKGKVNYFKNGNVQEIECNNGWIIFNDFVLVIDANFPVKAALLVQEIKKTTNKPIRYIFNTHHHGDHLYGNSVWVRQGAIAIAHTGVIHELHCVETGYYENKPGRWEKLAKSRADLREKTWAFGKQPYTYPSTSVF